MSNPILQPSPIADVIRSAFDDVNIQQIAVLARLTPAQRARIMFDLIEFQRQKIFAFEKQRDPDASDQVLWTRVRRRIELSYDDQTIQRLCKFDYPFA